MSIMQLNNEKGMFSKGKITKSTTTFMQNKLNSPIVQTDVTFFKTMNYTIFASLTKVKNKPNSNPIKAKTNPIQTQLPQREKLMQNLYSQRIMKKYADCGHVKTKPKQTQFQALSSNVAVGEPKKEV